MLADHDEPLEAAVHGVPAELGGQQVMVATARRPESDNTAEQLLGYCTGKTPHFAVPRYVRFMDNLPRSHAQRSPAAAPASDERSARAWRLDHQVARRDQDALRDAGRA